MIRNKWDKELAIEWKDAKTYFAVEPTEPGEAEWLKELQEAETEEEFCEILNRETDRYGNGTRYYVA